MNTFGKGSVEDELKLLYKIAVSVLIVQMLA